MMEPLRNKWAVGVIAFSVVTVLVYIFMPLFKIPIFGISSGVEWIRMVWMTKDFANIVSFLLPFIGAAGAISVVLTKKIEPHILSVAFALLQVIFFAYFLMRMGAFVDSGVSAGGISLLDLIGSALQNHFENVEDQLAPSIARQHAPQQIHHLLCHH